MCLVEDSGDYISLDKYEKRELHVFEVPSKREVSSGVEPLYTVLQTVT